MSLDSSSNSTSYQSSKLFISRTRPCQRSRHGSLLAWGGTGIQKAVKPSTSDCSKAGPERLGGQHWCQRNSKKKHKQAAARDGNWACRQHNSKWH
eukprot:5631149-Pleurochrysis_carterae.AAC.4